ncbi:MAG: phytoene desaturase [Bacteroidetes bacterium]|nr:phytoene desaturase [Bacteroidota bacterium]
MTTSHAIVIGSGIGGLSTAIRLAVKGYAVTVFEKNERAGGKLGWFERSGYHFDTGPSLFTQPGNIETLFQLAGIPMEPYFSYQRVDIACRYFYENGKRIDAHARPEDFARELAAVAGEDPRAVIAYLKESAQVYEHVGKIFLEHSLHKASTWLHTRTLQALRHVGWGHLMNTLDSFNRSRFRSPEAVQLFNRYATYNGSDPFQAPGMLSLIPHLEQNEGTYYPKGGMIAIPQALYALACDLGVSFRFNTPVTSILQEHGRVKGIQADGQPFWADTVVSNMDVFYTWRDLLQDPGKAAAILRRERSSSALIFYWGMAMEFPQLHLHNIFFSTDYAAEFAHIFRQKKTYPDPTIYINITSKMEEGQAPPGKENWFVMVNVPSGALLSDDAAKEQLRAAILEKLSRMLGVSIEPCIETEDVLTPEGIEANTYSYKGSLYGTSSNARWAAFLRHANTCSGIRGLYFTGGSVHPGGGIPLCLKSAQIVDSMIPAAL